MRTTEEFKKLVFERAEEKAAEQRRQRKAIRNFSLLFALCIVIFLSAYLGVRVFSPAGSAGNLEEMPTNTKPLETVGSIPDGTKTEDVTAALNSQVPSETNPSATTAAYTTAPMTTPASTTAALQTTSIALPETTAPAWEKTYTLVQATSSSMADNFLMCVFFKVGVPDLTECMTAYTSKESFLSGFGYDREIGKTSRPSEKTKVYAIWYKSTCPPAGIYGAEQDGHLYFCIAEFEEQRGKEEMYLCLVPVSKAEAPYEGLLLGEEKKNIPILPDDSVVQTGTGFFTTDIVETDQLHMAEHMEFFSAEAALEARFAGENVSLSMYDSEFFLNNNVYALWVRRSRKPTEVNLEKKDGEYVFDIRCERGVGGEEKVYLLLVSVPKDYPRIGGMLSEMKYVIW